MLSTSLEVVGLAAIAAGVLMIAGPGAALLCAGAELLFLGYATDGVHPVATARERLRTARAARAQRRGQAREEH